MYKARNNNVFWGAHIAGDPKFIIKVIENSNINAIQYMPSAPIRWATSISEKKESDLLEVLKIGQIEKVLMHGIYLNNLARKDKQLFHMSKVSFLTYLQYMLKVEEKFNKKGVLIGVCVHPGSAKDLSKEDGIKRISYGLDWILEQFTSHDLDKLGRRVLLEISAGAGDTLGRNLQELSEIKSLVSKSEHIGFVLDTQHMFASGYDWVNSTESILKEVEEILGIDSVVAVHLNNSATQLASNKDRHANLLEGIVPKSSIKKIVDWASSKGKPLILETPAMKYYDSIIDEISILEEIINE